MCLTFAMLIFCFAVDSTLIANGISHVKLFELRRKEFKVNSILFILNVYYH